MAGVEPDHRPEYPGGKGHRVQSESQWTMGQSDGIWNAAGRPIGCKECFSLLLNQNVKI